MSHRTSPSWMWADALEMLRRAERLQRQFFRPGHPVHSHAVWEPPVDLTETDTDLDIVVALPGVQPDRLRVGFEDGVVLIEAFRPLPAPAVRSLIHRLEIPYGRFERRIPLPPGRYELLEQSLTQGCLHLKLAKRR